MTFKSLISQVFAMGIMLLAVQSSFSGELRYVPNNPSFGGNPANASGLMAVATAQNDFKAPSVTKTALEKFTDDLETAIYNRLQNTVVNQLFTTNGSLVSTGAVNAGNFKIEIKSENNGLVLVTTDRTSGASTTINIDALQ